MVRDKRDDSFQIRFVRLTHLYYKSTFAILSETGIHPKQIPLMMLLNDREGMSQKEISEVMRISPPTVAVSMKRLEKAGLVERKADEEDQRRIRIYLTGKGKDLIEKARECIEENEKKVFRGFSESELCLMKRFFDQMIRNLGGDEEGICGL